MLCSTAIAAGNVILCVYKIMLIYTGCFAIEAL